MAAGDGTFMNIVKDIKSFGITFVQLPFGTANDLSRAFNWGPKPSRKMRFNIELLCEELCSATETTLDVWEINVITDGSKSIGEAEMTKLMCHSFSFGVDARIGFNFEKKRTRSRFWNQFRYGLEGLKRL